MGTPNYNLPEFEADTPPDLMTVVNGGFGTIDSTLKSLADRITALEGSEIDTTPTSVLTTEGLAKVGITKDGLLVNTQPTI